VTVGVAASSVFLCVYAFLPAALEVEIEGPRGWAERLPTWYRSHGVLGGVFAVLGSGKPLTGYHFFLFPFTLMSFHLPFVFGLPWTGARELTIMAAWVAWLAAWDALWFVINPAYGWRRLRREYVWWHRHWVGPVPFDYLVALVLSLGLAAAAQQFPGGRNALRDQAILLAAFVVWTAVVAALAPLYHRWYRRMHDPAEDDRGGAGIKPPPD
jgi:hypothetical protein